MNFHKLGFWIGKGLYYKCTMYIHHFFKFPIYSLFEISLKVRNQFKYEYNNSNEQSDVTTLCIVLWSKPNSDLKNNETKKNASKAVKP
jgi:hypothetical protein